VNNEVKKLAKEVSKELIKEDYEKKKKSIYHNTRLLMKYYNDLKIHYEKGVSDVKDMDIDIENMDESDLYIYSIKHSKIKTLIMISHLDFAMAALKNKQKKNGTFEKYRAIELYYIHNLTYSVVAEKLNCSEMSVRRWIKEMTTDLGIFLFGIEGLKL
jgi:hypothetical protein